MAKKHLTDEEIARQMEESGRTIDEITVPIIEEDEEELKKELAALEAKKAEAKAKMEENENKEEGEKDKIDWEKKFKESSKEALLLLERIKKLEAREKEREEETNKVEITDEELQKKYPDWEELTEAEQTLIREQEKMKLELQRLRMEKDKYAKDREWRNDVRDFLKKQKILESSLWEAIKDYQDEFVEFATKDTRRGMDLDILSRAFVQTLSEKGKLKKKSPEKKSMNIDVKGNAASKSGPKISIEEARVLRKTDPKKYREYLMRDLIDF